MNESNVHFADDTDSDAESWDEEVIGLEECLFCSHISSTLEKNVKHMNIEHSFFLPDEEFISDLEQFILCLGRYTFQLFYCKYIIFPGIL